MAFDRAIGSKSLNGGNLTYDVIDDQIDVDSVPLSRLDQADRVVEDHLPAACEYQHRRNSGEVSVHRGDVGVTGIGLSDVPVVGGGIAERQVVGPPVAIQALSTVLEVRVRREEDRSGR